MFKNHVKIALRNLFKNKTFSLINVAGLAIGMACCLLILLYVRSELSYDNFHKNRNRIYRIGREVLREDNVTLSAWTPVPLGPALKADFPETEEVVRFWRAFQPIIGFQEKRFREQHFYFTDPGVFTMFSFEMLEGNPATALSEPNTVVLTESTAKKYFGEENPCGKILSYRGYPAGEQEYMVTGILADLPANTHFRFDFLASLQGVETEKSNWGSNKPIWTYVLLPKNYPPQQFDNKLIGYFNEHYPSQTKTELHVEPMTDIHLYSPYSGGFKPNSDITYIYIFSAIGFFILIIACINFMNLATARSLKRAKEVSMRKVLGAYRLQLMRQFLGEALLLSLLALIMALVMLEFSLPWFNTQFNLRLSIEYFHNIDIIFTLLFIILGVGLLAGSYPAFFLARFKPVAMLRGRFVSGASGVALRKGLVVLQFTISIILITATLLMYKQLEYVRHKKLGFDKDLVVVLPYSENEEPLLTALSENPNVLNVSVSQRVPVNEINSDSRTIRLEGSEEPIRVESYLIDSRFLETYRIKLIAGRNLSDKMATDDEAFLINETAVKELGWHSPEEALGKQIVWSGYKQGFIVGVIEDFHTTSLHEKIEPLVLHTISDETWWRTFISVRIRPQNIDATLAFLEKTWSHFTPDGAYDSFFIDESLAQLHRADQQFERIFAIFAALAIFIAGLGLFALSTFSAEQRTKEIGIRKVLGASVTGIVALLSTEFMKLVLIASILAWPAAYSAMNKWLQNFAYRIQIGPLVFLTAAGLAIFIALLTISYQSIRAALANPVKSLRYE